MHALGEVARGLTSPRPYRDRPYGRRSLALTELTTFAHQGRHAIVLKLQAPCLFAIQKIFIPFHWQNVLLYTPLLPKMQVFYATVLFNGLKSYTNNRLLNKSCAGKTSTGRKSGCGYVLAYKNPL